MKTYSLIQVAINQYASAPLNGCINDAKNLQAAVRQRFAINWHSQLLNREATADAMRQTLKQTVSRDTDITLVHFSGHGSFVPDINDDETDSRFDQVLVPVDYETKGMLLDDELGALADQYESGRKLIYWLDSCHSGGSARSFGLGFLFHATKKTFKSPSVRALPAHLVTQKVIDETHREVRQLGLFSGGKKKNKAAIYNSERHIVIATARHNETAADAWIDKTWQGAGTAALLWAWKKLGRTYSYESVADEANAWLARNRYTQRIVIEGSRENLKRPFLT